MRILSLVPDAYGGRGGIASYNRNLLQAICQHPRVEQVVAIPRRVVYEPEALPQKLVFNTSASDSKMKYLLSCIRIALGKERFDLIVCTHLNLLPFAFLVKSFMKCPVLPVIYGLEAWRPTSHWMANRLCRRLETLVTMREFTARRFTAWAGLKHVKLHCLPNCIDETQFGVGRKPQGLLDLYGIAGKTVIMTAGRLDEKKKGFDEILEVLPELRKQVPDLAYLIVGDGPDKERLAQKANELGVDNLVVFAGYVPEAKKADYYRLADVFAMPGSDRDFDTYPYRFVFLEALACGVPVVGSRLEDESERKDPCARKMMIQVDPKSKEEILRGILKALPLSGRIPPELTDFYYPSFAGKVHRIIDGI